MGEQNEQIKYDPESMCLPNSLESAVQTLLGEKAQQLDFEKYRQLRAQQLKEELRPTSPISTAKRENEGGKVVRLIAENRDSFVGMVLGEVSQQTGVELASHTEYISAENTERLLQLINEADTVCLLSTRDHIEPLTAKAVNEKLKSKIDDSFELAPFGNVTVIKKLVSI